jgi:large subunit ribosomal protein L6
MSRIGNQPIPLPPKVEVTLAPGSITVKGPLGSLTRSFGSALTIERSGDTLVCKAEGAESPARCTARCGRSSPNMVKGVSVGYEKKLTLVGVGFRAQAAGDKVNLSLGFSHPVVHAMPKGVKVETPRRRRSSSRASTSSRSARWRRRSAPTGRRTVQGQGGPVRERVREDQRNEEEVEAFATDVRGMR